MKNTFFRSICVALITSMCALCIPANAAPMLSTESAIEVSAERSEILAFFDRADVVSAMQNQGVSAAEAKARVAAMSDQEIHALKDKIGDLPAGGDVLGLIFLVFIILLITDIVGLTKVFPFTRSMR